MDKKIGGFIANGVHIIHGQPGSGKTAFILQIAAACGCPCLIVTCEMTPLELFRRIIARATGTFLGRLKTGELTPDAAMRLAYQALETCPDLYLMDSTRSYALPSDILEASKEIQKRSGVGHFLLVVDSVHAWAGGDEESGETEYDKLNSHLMTLGRMAAGLKCGILAVAERNRASMKLNGQNSSAGTRKFEYGGDTVFGLERNQEEKPDGEGMVNVKLHVSKNRNGELGEIALRFHGATQTFKEEYTTTHEKHTRNGAGHGGGGYLRAAHRRRRHQAALHALLAERRERQGEMGNPTTRYPTNDELAEWFSQGSNGIGRIGGPISGNLETLDFNRPGIYDEYEYLCDNNGLGDLVRSLPLVQTPKDGRHLYYRCEEPVNGDLKLAYWWKPGTEGVNKARLHHGEWVEKAILIETRGDKGYAVAPGSPLTCHPTGNPYAPLRGMFTDIPTISAEERRALLSLARMMDSAIEDEQIVTGQPPVYPRGREEAARRRLQRARGL